MKEKSFEPNQKTYLKAALKLNAFIQDVGNRLLMGRFLYHLRYKTQIKELESACPRDPGSPETGFTWNLNTLGFGGDCTPQSLTR